MGSSEHYENQVKNDFCKIIDEVLLNSDSDPEFRDAVVWLDTLVRNKYISLYDLVFEILEQHDVEERVKLWREENKKG